MSERWTPLQQLLESGVSQKVYTAAVALVGLKGELLWEGAAGRLSRDAQDALVNMETVFDLASLTKPLATALALMVLAGRQEVSLTTSLGQVLPNDWLPPDKHGLTLGSILTHRSGLPAWRPFYREVLAAPAPARPTLLERLAAAAPLEHVPATVTVYSDLGFMLLKAVVEHISGMRLNQFCQEEIYRPLGLNILGFIPLPKPAQAALTTEYPRYAATERGLIAGRTDAGEVHDENAWAAGGVAGQAGLFGPGREVFELVACLYHAYGGDGVGPLTPDAAKHFLTVPPEADRAYGFDTPSGTPATRAAGRYFSPNSVGHLGFTGTSFWLDLTTGLMVVLLTNRVHLGRDDKTKIAAFRPRFHEAASRALGFG
ncbi:MAG: serine hydrolase domain-containing protein [Thermodesulfobacteriota bacterium]